MGTVNTGIGIEPQLPGFVPEYECREVAAFAHYNWDEWLELTNGNRVRAIAHYRLHRLVDQHVQHALTQHSEMQRVQSRQT
jgi:hypothetical protein